MARSRESEVEVLIASTVRQDPDVLACFLASVGALETGTARLGRAFVDDNDDPESSRLLRAACGPGDRILAAEGPRPPYVRGEVSHRWTDALMRRVARAKDRLIALAIELGTDFLFLVDSDLVLHPKTLRVLLAARHDIVAEVFWTRWDPEAPPQPQVWLTDTYDLHYRLSPGERVSGDVAHRRAERFLAGLRRPGLYQVGGLGACTLISRRALRAGVRFEDLYNLSFQGEDRHFCVRATGIEQVGSDLFDATSRPSTSTDPAT